MILKKLSLVIILSLLASSTSFAQSGGPFTMNQQVLVPGADSPAGGPFAVQNTIGLPVAGPIAGGPFAIQAGFWNGTALATAATVKVSGRLFDSHGDSLLRASISLTDVHGMVFAARSGRKGTFELEVPAGETYVVTISSRTSHFAPQILDVRDSITGLEFRPID